MGDKMITAELEKGDGCLISDASYIGYQEHGGEIILGNDVTIMHGCVIRTCTGKIKIGDLVSIGYNCIMHGMGGIDIGDFTLISPGVHIYAQDHGVAKGRLIREQENVPKHISIGSDCWIGAGAIILGGAVIRDGCVIGAGAVMSGETLYDEIWVGNPAVLIRERGYG